jgi:hypothetical protein
LVIGFEFTRWFIELLGNEEGKQFGLYTYQYMPQRSINLGYGICLYAKVALRICIKQRER